MPRTASSSRSVRDEGPPAFAVECRRSVTGLSGVAILAYRRRDWNPGQVVGRYGGAPSGASGHQIGWSLTLGDGGLADSSAPVAAARGYCQLAG